jgi:hypothetical protein
MARRPPGGVKVTVVASEAKFIDKPVNGGGPNPLCADAPQMTPAAGENQRTIGVLVSYNSFTYLNTIDIDWGTEMLLACPINKVGQVTVFQTGRHGAGDGANAPGFIGAIKPQVVVVNNGPRKGLGATDDRVKPISQAKEALGAEHLDAVADRGFDFSFRASFQRWLCGNRPGEGRGSRSCKG